MNVLYNILIHLGKMFIQNKSNLLKTASLFHLLSLPMLE